MPALCTKETLIAFEEKLAKEFEQGRIRAPIHLSGNNEDALIEIFKEVDPHDWVFSTWRSHYHGLLKGVPCQQMWDECMAGNSITLCFPEHKFYTSAIVGGTIPIAVGVAAGIKRRAGREKVWCFIGDMAVETGIFWESVKYAHSHQLPIRWVIEDNNFSTSTPSRETWGRPEDDQTMLNVLNLLQIPFKYYFYTRKYPHQGIGKWVAF